jgi:predicted dehydrogenase
MHKLGIIGLSPGNGHPYSWSVIFNGYNRDAMADCPFPTIPEYLFDVDPEHRGVAGAQVTHIWTQDRATSEHVAAASRIENVVDEMADLIGAVDAILLARDDGENHLAMARPFIEAGVPIFIDKLLAGSPEDLAHFIKYYEAGKPMMCCSSMRYIPQVTEARTKLGRVLTANAICAKYWNTYAIHLLEAIGAVMGPGVESVQNVGRKGEEIVHMEYADGRHAVAQTFSGIEYTSHIGFYGDRGSMMITEVDAYATFSAMLAEFIQMLDTGVCPLDWHDTVELARVVVAGNVSLNEGGRKVTLNEVS